MLQKVPLFNKVKEGRDEEILDPEIVILDAHHHLFDRPHLRYMFEGYLSDANAGHKSMGSVYIETQVFARPDGPDQNTMLRGYVFKPSDRQVTDFDHIWPIHLDAIRPCQNSKKGVQIDLDSISEN